MLAAVESVAGLPLLLKGELALECVELRERVVCNILLYVAEVGEPFSSEAKEPRRRLFQSEVLTEKPEIVERLLILRRVRSCGSAKGSDHV